MIVTQKKHRRKEQLFLCLLVVMYFQKPPRIGCKTTISWNKQFFNYLYVKSEPQLYNLFPFLSRSNIKKQISKTKSFTCEKKTKGCRPDPRQLLFKYSSCRNGTASSKQRNNNVPSISYCCIFLLK